MKIRTGFVSNSSSSSFLLVFDKKPKSALDVLVQCWPKLGVITDSYGEDEGIPTSLAAEKVWGQMEKSGPLGVKEIAYEFSSCDEIADVVSNSPTRVENMPWDAISKEMAIRAQAKAKEFLTKHAKKFIYRVEFSDNDGHFDSMMEHGEAFENITHVKFSHH